MKVLIVSICMCGVLIALPFSTARAATDNLTRGQVGEALEFGRANQLSIEKTLMKLYGCGPGAPEVVVRTKWCKLALLAGIKAQQGMDVSGREQEDILRDAALQLDITVYGSSIEFARSYTVHALQDGMKILPDIFHADHFQASPQTKTAQQGFSPYYATIRAYFRYDALDVKKPFSLVLVKPQGIQTYKIDPNNFK